eukprot:gene15758-21339_t
MFFCVLLNTIFVLFIQWVNATTDLNNFFDEQLHLHAKISPRNADGINDLFQQHSPESDKLIKSFFEKYGHEFGIDIISQLEHKKILFDATSGVAYHHFQQKLDKITVFGGEIVVALGRHGNVIHAHGCGISSKTYPQVLENTQNMPALSIPRMKFIHDYISKSILDEKSIFESWMEESWKIVDTVWYRTELLRGREGVLRLSYQISGPVAVAVNSSNQLLTYLAFVDAFTGEVIEVFDQTMSVKKTDYFSTADNVQDQRLLMNISNSTNLRRRNLLIYTDFGITVKNVFNTSIVYLSPSTSPTVALREDVRNVSSAGAGIAYLFRSLSNQTWKDFHATTTTSSSLTSYIGLNGWYSTSNFFYSETLFSVGMTVTDIVGREWTHGYTRHTSNLQYRYQSGSLRAAFGDIFGEGLDIVTGGQLRNVLRSSNQTCTSYNWRLRSTNVPIGKDSSYRWLIGEDCGVAYDGSRLGAFRDMYYPECFGDPSTTYSSNYDCTGNADETITNAGVINRLFAVIADGGIYADPAGGSDLVVTGLGLTKSLNLFRKTMLSMTSVTNFPGFASILSNTCSANIGATLFIPQSTYAATSTVSYETLSSDDCNQVTTAITGAGLSRDESMVCTPSSPTAYPTQSPTGPSSVPTSRPTPVITASFTCPAYNVSSTNFATRGYDSCCFQSCGVANLSISSCGCTGETFARLTNSSGDVLFVYYDNGYCTSNPTCFSLLYSAPSTCTNYCLREGCYGDQRCSGTFTVVSYGGTLSFIQNSTTISPTISPTKMPNTKKTTKKPSKKPTIKLHFKQPSKRPNK